ncbi:beta-lactamase family protein [Paenibacillus sp. MER TA 81-3]|uniref:serine hydrolase domain-containing protein n=1 Tax=Paenibacillus sp. MER TA 81-3 TaxID=2939573 RepID=UPI00203BDAC9|nr:serine hydrolase [Paenibacillus sp. MER TA 81-3]MCM3342527.1 beta-lactamase family protein [Paenibacillus sp. MER TA 81-3]
MKLERKVASNLKLHNVYLLVHSDKLDIHWPMAAGETDGFTANPKQPYHTASVGKTFTSVLLAILVEKGLVKFDDPIANYLPPDILKDLHLFKGKEYTYDIQIKHLLSNTSGIPDYFEDNPRQGKALMEEILENPSRFWTPQETIYWSKEHLQPRFPPGKRVHYTDTGYNLLGLIIETITSKPFHEVLHDYIFTPSDYSKRNLGHHAPMEQNVDRNGLWLWGDEDSFSSFHSKIYRVGASWREWRLHALLPQHGCIYNGEFQSNRLSIQKHELYIF